MSKFLKLKPTPKLSHQKIKKGKTKKKGLNLNQIVSVKV